MSKFNPLPGGSYIELPEQLKKITSITNIVNNDNYCFLYSLIAKDHPVKCRKNTVTQYKKYLSEYINNQKFTYPMMIENISEFEIEFKKSINVYGVNINKDNSFEIIPRYITKTKNTDIEQHYNLLYWSNDGEHYHYALITSISSLLRVNTYDHTYYICPFCFNNFGNKIKLRNHINDDCFIFDQRTLPNGKQYYDYDDELSLIREKIDDEYYNINREYKNNIKKCIYNCIQSDKKKLNWIGNGKLDHIGNIDYKYIRELLKDQNYRCYLCNDKLTMVKYVPYCCYKFSIDRLDNKKPHDKENVKISCYFCNCKDHILYDKQIKIKCQDNNCFCNNLIFNK